MSSRRPMVQVAMARGFWSRLVGLLGRASLEDGQGLWIEPCRCVHTVGMQFDIDLVFVDREHTILRLVRGVPPWRVAACRRASAVIELAAGSCDRLQLQRGQRWPFKVERS